MTIRSSLSRRLRFEVRSSVLDRELPSQLLLRLPARNGVVHPPVTRATDLVVDGVQCSGNSFLTRWLVHTNPHLAVSGHFHSSGQVLRARRLGVPAVVLIRDPVEVTASAITRWPWLTPGAVLGRWTSYYTALESRWSDLIVVRSEDLFVDLAGSLTTIRRSAGVALDHPSPQDRLSGDYEEAASRTQRSRLKAHLIADAGHWNRSQTDPAKELYERLGGGDRP